MQYVHFFCDIFSIGLLDMMSLVELGVYYEVAFMSTWEFMCFTINGSGYGHWMEF